MAQYIPKSALVAEIKERIKTYNKGYANGDDSRADALEVLLHDIDILKVKEVNEIDIPVSHSLTEEGLFTFKDGSQAIITKIE